jgi:type VI secretion system secreted protein VgrG
LKVGFDKKDSGDHTIEIFNNQDLTIGCAQAKDGSQTTEIWKDQNTTLKQGNQTTKLDLGKANTEAMQSIELKVGSNSILIDQTGITIKGLMVTVQGDVKAEVKSPMTDVKGDGMLTIKGGITMIN